MLWTVLYYAQVLLHIICIEEISKSTKIEDPLLCTCMWRLVVIIVVVITTM